MELDVNHKSIQSGTNDQARNSSPEEGGQNSLVHPSPRLLELLERPLIKSLITSDSASAPIEELIVEALEKLLASNQEKNEQISQLVHIQLSSMNPIIPPHQLTFGDKANLPFVFDQNSSNQKTYSHPLDHGQDGRVSAGVNTDLTDQPHGLNLSHGEKPTTLKKNISKSQIIMMDGKHSNSVQNFLDNLAERIQQKDSMDYNKSISSERNISKGEENRLSRVKKPTLVLRSPSGIYEDDLNFNVLNAGLTKDGEFFQTQNLEDTDENGLAENEQDEAIVINDSKPESKSEIPVVLSQFTGSKNEQSDNVSNYYCPPQRYNDFNVSCISYSAVSKSQVSKFEPNLTNNLTQALKKSMTDSVISNDDLLARIDKQLQESNQKWMPSKESEAPRITLGHQDQTVINEAPEELETITGSFKEGSFKPVPNEFKNDLLDQVDKAIIQWNKKLSTKDREINVHVIDENESAHKSNELSHRTSSPNNPFRQTISPGPNSDNPSKEPSRKTLNFQDRSRESIPGSLKIAKKLNDDVPLPERETLRSMVRAPSGRNNQPVNNSTDTNRLQSMQKRPNASPDCMAYREIKWQNHQPTLSNVSSQYQTNPSIRMDPPASIGHFYSNTVRTVSRSIDKGYSPSYKLIIEPPVIKPDLQVAQSVTPLHKVESHTNYTSGKPHLYLAPPPPLYVSKHLRESNYSRGENQPSHSRELYLVRMDGERSVYRYKEDLNK